MDTLRTTDDNAPTFMLATGGLKRVDERQNLAKTGDLHVTMELHDDHADDDVDADADAAARPDDVVVRKKKPKKKKKKVENIN